MTKTTALQTVDYSEYANMGLKDITAEDIMPPMAFLVQSIKDKSELVDATGKKCPDGSFFMKGSNEIMETIPAYFVWVKKDHYKVKDSDRDNEKKMQWDGVRMYRAVAIRADEMTPFAFTFAKSSMGGLNDLFTTSRSKNLPIFKFKCELKTVIKTNKDGQDYFVSVVAVKGIEENEAILTQLFQYAKGFDFRDVTVDETEEAPVDSYREQPQEKQGATVQEVTESLIKTDPAADAVAEDVPF